MRFTLGASSGLTQSGRVKGCVLGEPREQLGELCKPWVSHDKLGRLSEGKSPFVLQQRGCPLHLLEGIPLQIHCFPCFSSLPRCSGGVSRLFNLHIGPYSRTSRCSKVPLRRCIAPSLLRTKTSLFP